MNCVGCWLSFSRDRSAGTIYPSQTNELKKKMGRLNSHPQKKTASTFKSGKEFFCRLSLLNFYDRIQRYNNLDFCLDGLMPWWQIDPLSLIPAKDKTD